MSGTGTIVRACQTYCFIVDDATGAEIFTHAHEFIGPPAAFRGIVGSRVQFNLIRTPHGLQAQDVQIVDGDAGRERGVIRDVVSKYGFIKPDNGGSLFFHVSEIVGDWPIMRGTRVTYTIGIDERIGKTRALAVRKES